MTEPALDHAASDAIAMPDGIRERPPRTRSAWTLWWGGVLAFSAAVALYLLSGSTNRLAGEIVATEDAATPTWTNTLGQEADWKFVTTTTGDGRTAEVELVGIHETPIQFTVSRHSKIPILRAYLRDVFRINKHEVFATYNGHGVLVHEDGRQREIRLLEPQGLPLRWMNISDASVVDRTLSILIKGRNNGRQRGVLLTYELPELQGRPDAPDIIWLPPSSADRLERPFHDGAFQPNSHDWAILTRTGEVEFSWGRRIPAPDKARKLWFRNADTLVIQRQTDDSIQFHTAALDVEPVEFSNATLSLPGGHVWDSQVIRSPDGHSALIRVNYFRIRKWFGYDFLNARSEFSLVSLADWTIQATASEATAGWRSNVSPPYLDAAFSSNGRHLRLARCNGQVEVVDIAKWLATSKGHFDD